jgi:hypothetical protein
MEYSLRSGNMEAKPAGRSCRLVVWGSDQLLNPSIRLNKFFSGKGLVLKAGKSKIIIFNQLI